MKDLTPTRDRILATALDEFSSRGFSATSMRRLARLVGLRAASIYSHFESKESILAELLRQEGPDSAVEILAEAQQLEQQPAKQIECLVELAAAAWSSLEARRVRALHARLTTEEMRRVSSLRYLGGVRRALTAIESLFEVWIANGWMLGDFSAEHLAWEFWAPLGNLRTSFWSLEAAESEIAEGVEFARRHAVYFVRRNNIVGMTPDKERL